MSDLVQKIRSALEHAEATGDGRTTMEIIEDVVASQPQERGEAVFYYRPRSDGLYEGPIHHSVIEPVRRNSKQWVPLFTHPTPDAGRVAELEAQLAASAEVTGVPGFSGTSG